MTLGHCRLVDIWQQGASSDDDGGWRHWVIIVPWIRDNKVLVVMMMVGDVGSLLVLWICGDNLNLKVLVVVPVIDGGWRCWVVVVIVMWRVTGDMADMVAVCVAAMWH